MKTPQRCCRLIYQFICLCNFIISLFHKKELSMITTHFIFIRQAAYVFNCSYEWTKGRPQWHVASFISWSYFSMGEGLLTNITQCVPYSCVEFKGKRKLGAKQAWRTEHSESRGAPYSARSRIKFVIHFMYIDCTYILSKKFKTTHRKLMSSCPIRMTLLWNTISKF
jgi:hypothetical protein